MYIPKNPDCSRSSRIDGRNIPSPEQDCSGNPCLRIYLDAWSMVGAILMTKHFSYILWGVGLWGVTIQTIGEQKLRLPFGQQLHVFFSEATKHQKETLAGLGPRVGVILDQVFFSFRPCPNPTSTTKVFSNMHGCCPKLFRSLQYPLGAA